MKIGLVVGVRPHFIKLGVLYPVITRSNEIFIINTGQHYDYAMSNVFWGEADLQAPLYNLDVGSGTHAEQTGRALIGVERACVEQKPDIVVVIGDANPSIAGALAAAKLGIPICHIEAGARSFKRTMPEEVNRTVIDSIASLHLCSTEKCVENLSAVGTLGTVKFVGDLLLDCVKMKRASLSPSPAKFLGINAKSYILATIHREENLLDRAKLRDLLAALSSSRLPVIFPLHPGTKKKLGEIGLGHKITSNIYFIDPVPHTEMLSLIRNAQIVVSDSNGVQRESFFLSVPCLILRDVTEYPETVESGCARLVGSSRTAIENALLEDWSGGQYRIELFGDGDAATKITEIFEALHESPS